MSLCTKVKGAMKSLTHLWTVKVHFAGRVVSHKARNAADAFEWADCYGVDCEVLILDFLKPYAARLAARDGVWVSL